MTNRRRIKKNRRKRIWGRPNRRIPYSWSQPEAEERLLPDTARNVALGIPVTDSHTHMLKLMLMMTLTMMMSKTEHWACGGGPRKQACGPSIEHVGYVEGVRGGRGGVQGRGFLLTNCLTFGNYWVAPKPSVFALYCVYCFTSSWLLISVLLHFCYCLLYTHSFTVLQFCSLLFLFFVSMFTVHCL